MRKLCPYIDLCSETTVRTQLKVLTVHTCTQLKVPTVHTCTQLKVPTVHTCTQLKVLTVHTCTQLKVLTVHTCTQLKVLTEIKNLPFHSLQKGAFAHDRVNVMML